MRFSSIPPVAAPARVSIVLPVHNGEHYLSLSVESCLRQTLTDWELILVDDCSTDSTPDIIHHFIRLDPRIRTIRLQPNRKLPGALNAGFELARGEYLTWTSDDNLFREEALDTLARTLDQHPTVDLVYSDRTEIDEYGRELRRVRVGPPEDILFFNVVGACFLYRRELHERLGGYAEDLFLAEDYDFFLRASGQARMLALHEDLYLYRRHPGALSSTQNAAARQAANRARLRALPDLAWAAGVPRSAAYLRMARSARKEGDAAAEALYLQRARDESPIMANLYLYLGKAGVALGLAAWRNSHHRSNRSGAYGSPTR